MRAKRPRAHPVSEGHSRAASEPNASPSETPPSQRERPDAKSRPPLRPPFHVTGERSDPSGLIEPESPRAQRLSGNPLLPTALVLSGLEHASVPCHRVLLRTLSENRVPFDEDSGGAKSSFWELPEDFILVYVCPFDPRERPSIHKSLVRHPFLFPQVLPNGPIAQQVFAQRSHCPTPQHTRSIYHLPRISLQHAIFHPIFHTYTAG
jgi:hypothetical protein